MLDPNTPNADKRSPLSRERIVATAIDYVDEHGIEALSMRHLGKAMGVEAMSLYNHVAGKDELLDRMADVMAEEMTQSAGSAQSSCGWRDALRGRAHAFRAVCARHPWAGLLLDTRLNASPTRLSYYDSMLGVLLASGFDPQQAVRAFLVMDSYLYGFEVQLRASRATQASNDEMATRLNRELPDGIYPNLKRVSTFVADNGYDQETDFDAGFELILNAIETMGKNKMPGRNGMRKTSPSGHR